jgi:F0F1-type ATP synthase gamma subunit
MGERGARYLEDMNQSFVFFPGISDQLNYLEAEGIRDYLIKGYHKRFGRILIIYPEFISLTVQRVTLLQLLPWSESAPDKEKEKAPSISLLTELMIEPSPWSVLEIIIELWTAFKLQDIFWSAKQAEYAARIMHLEGSTQELGHLTHKLAFEYFRQVHALKDKVIREISASKILLSKQGRG